MSSKRDSVWDHFIDNRVGTGPRARPVYICKYCSHEQHHRAPARAYIHLAQCTFAPQDIQNEYDCSPSASKKRKLDSPLFVDSMSTTQQDDLEQELCQWIFAAGLPFSVVEHPAFKKFMSKARPSFEVPKRKRLSTTLIQREYDRQWAKLQKTLEATERVGIVSDGWTNTNSAPIVNYLLSSGDQCYFYRSVYTEDNRHTGDYIAQGFLDTINEVGADKVISITTDNAANMKAAWSIVKLSHPHIVTVGCCAHRLNLLANDIVKLPAVEETWTKALFVAKWMKTHTLAIERVKKHAALRPDIKFKAFQLPGNTRWQGKVNTLTALIHNWIPLQQALLELRSEPIYTGDPAFNQLLGIVFEQGTIQLDFCSKLTQLQGIFKPLLQASIALETSQPKMSTAYY